jgi:hypothetical protein
MKNVVREVNFFNQGLKGRRKATLQPGTHCTEEDLGERFVIHVEDMFREITQIQCDFPRRQCPWGSVHLSREEDGSVFIKLVPKIEDE